MPRKTKQPKRQHRPVDKYCIVKIAKPSGDAAHVYVPPPWAGQMVAVIPIEVVDRFGAKQIVDFIKEEARHQ